MKIELGENTLDKRGISETQREGWGGGGVGAKLCGAVEHDIKEINS